MSQSTRGFAKGTVGIKALIIIAAISIAHQAYLSSGYVNDEEVSFADFSYGISSLAVGIVALIVAKRYWGVCCFWKNIFCISNWIHSFICG